MYSFRHLLSLISSQNYLVKTSTKITTIFKKKTYLFMIKITSVYIDKKNAHNVHNNFASTRYLSQNVHMLF